MHDPAKLPVEMWAEVKHGRTRVLFSVDGGPPVEFMSWPSDAIIQNGTVMINMQGTPMTVSEMSTLVPGGHSTKR